VTLESLYIKLYNVKILSGNIGLTFLSYLEFIKAISLIRKNLDSTSFDATLRHANLSDNERQWLAEKLSDWLKVPVNKYLDYDENLNRLSR
jgi:hypothetical protein